MEIGFNQQGAGNVDEDMRGRIDALKAQLDGLDASEGPTYDDLLRFVTDCAHTPIEGDWEKDDGRWSESEGLDPGAVDEFYETTVEWARTLIRMSGPQHFDEEGAIDV